MTRWQLRMYRVHHGELDEWLREWRERVPPLRGAEYYASPERAALEPDAARHLAEARTWLLEEL